jgi:hypothetical protein
MKSRIPFGDWNADPDEVELAGFECTRCKRPVRLRFSYLGEDDESDSDPENWNLNFACDCGFAILFCRCMDLNDHPRIPRDAQAWEALTKRMHQSGIRNLMIAGDQEAPWYGARESRN